MTLNLEDFNQRLSYGKIAPDVLRVMRELGECVKKSGIEIEILDFVKIRASQLNSCAFCLDMHIKDAIARGENQQRIDLLPVWREVAIYTKRERAALAWTESVTKLDPEHVPQELYDVVKEQFTEKELIYLTLAIIEINSWNRLNISFRLEAGKYISPINK